MELLGFCLYQFGDYYNEVVERSEGSRRVWVVWTLTTKQLNIYSENVYLEKKKWAGVRYQIEQHIGNNDKEN